MDIPGMPDALSDRDVAAKAETEAERLLAELKEKVRVELEDIGSLRKNMRVTVPAEVIRNHLEHNYAELRSDALVPGFRKGRAPLQLVEKRFGHDVRDSAKTSIIGQSFLAAAENNDIEALGDPMFHIDTDDGARLAEFTEAAEHLTLRDDEDFSYSCEVDVKPTFELPKLEGIEIISPQIEINDEMIDEHLERQGKIRGRFEPLTEGAAESEDMIIADVAITCEGAEVKTEDNVQLGLRSTRLDGIPVLDLEKVLDGVKPGDLRNTKAEIPQDYERPDLRGKTAEFSFKVHEIKRLMPLGLEALCEQLGCEDEKELREVVRDDLDHERAQMLRRAEKNQVLDYLLEQTRFDVPENLSARQTDRAVMRKVIDLQQRGVPESEIEEHIDELRTSARDETARNLKLEFIFEKVAEKLDATATDEEVNSEIARMARTYNRRFDRVRDDLQSRGLLGQLAEQIRQDKCMQILIRDAKIVEARPEDVSEKKKAKPKKKKPAAKSSPAEASTRKKSTKAKPAARKSTKKKKD